MNKRYFKYIVILIPFLFLLLLELLLGLFSFGYSTDLFVIRTHNDGKKYYYLNRTVVQKYFSNKVKMTPAFERFPVKKSRDTIRILCFGGSSLQGFPYLKNLAIPGLIEQILNKAQRYKKYEIINTAVTALDSSIVLDMVKKAGGYGADYYLFFTGHNEFYGARGYSSTLNPKNNFLNNMRLSLRNLKIFQMFESIVYSIVPAAKTFHSVIPLLVKDNIVTNSAAVNKQVLKKYSININEMIEIAKKRKVKTILFTLPSNIKDSEPFQSIRERPYYLSRFRMNSDKRIIDQAYKINMKEIKDSLNKNTNDAMCNYIYACKLYQRGKKNTAREYFKRAKDLDMLKLRASSQLNEFLRKNKQRVDCFYDFTKIINDKSKSKIGDNEYFTEYLHPNIKANIMAAVDIAKMLEPDLRLESFNIKKLDYSIVDIIHTSLSLWIYFHRYPFILNNYKNKLLINKIFKVKGKKLSLKKEFSRHQGLFDALLNLSIKLKRKNNILKSHREAARYYYDKKDYKNAKKELLIVKRIHDEHILNLRELLYVYMKLNDRYNARKINTLINNLVKKK